MLTEWNPAYKRGGHSGISHVQFLEQRPRVLQVRGIKAFREPLIGFSE
jgi:hypothetical protein